MAGTPKTRVEFWSEKFARNVERDLANVERLKTLGWQVGRIWECETKDAAVLAAVFGMIVASPDSLTDVRPIKRYPFIEYGQVWPRQALCQTALETGASDDGIRSVSGTIGDRVWDACYGDDRVDPSDVFCSGQSDQGDRHISTKSPYTNGPLI